MRTRAFLPLAFCLAASAGAQSVEPRQEPSVLRQGVEQFLRIQATGLPGEVQVSVGQIDSRSALPACAAPEYFLPGGSRAWGKTTVGVRCSVPSPWTIYVQAAVRVRGDYVVTAIPVQQGRTLEPGDLTTIRGDLTSLPAGIVTDPALAVGRTAAVSLSAGTPLRADALRSVQAVQQGQSVQVVSQGPGFRVTAEGRALNNAAEGQVAQARTPSGQVVSGIARAGGVVEVRY